MSRKSRKSRQAQAEDALDEIFQDPEEGAPYTDEVEVYDDTMHDDEHLQVHDDVHEVSLNDHFEQTADQEPQHIEEDYEDADELLDESFDQEPAEAPEAPAVPVRPAVDRPAPRSGGGSLFLFGLLFLILGVGLIGASLALPAKMGALLTTLAKVGASPALLLVLGAALTSIAMVIRRQSDITGRVHQLEDALVDGESGLSANIEFLVEAQAQHAERAPASGEELERVLMAMERQDEKINNLTRATKMYGKPLIEVTKQLSEMASRQEAMRDTLKGLGSGNGEDLDKLAQKLETSLQKTSGADDEVHGLLKEIRREVAGLATSMARIQSAPAAAPAKAPASAPANTAAPASSAAPAASSDGKPAGDNVLAQSISGTQRTAGKGVLGSIEKLKKMRK